MALSDINPLSYYQDPANLLALLGYSQQDSGDGNVYWVSPEGSRVRFDEGGQPILNDNGRSGSNLYSEALAQQGYAKNDEIQNLQGMTPEQALQAFYGAGSQYVDDPIHGRLIRAGNPDSSQWNLPNMEGFGNGFLDNFADAGGVVGLAGLGFLGPGLAAQGAAGGAASDLGWAAGLTDAAGGSLAAPELAGSAYAGLGGAAAGTGASMSNFFPGVLDEFGANPVMNSIQSQLGSAGAGFEAAAPTFQAAEGMINPAWFSGSTLPSWLTTAGNAVKSLFSPDSSTDKGFFGNGGIFGTGLTGGNLAAIAPSLAAIQYARNQDPFDTSKLESIYSGLQGNQSPYLQAMTNPYDEQTALGRGRLTQSLSDRGVYGSSFGNMDLTNFDTVRGRGRADILGTGMNNQLTLQGGIAGKLIDTQAREQEMKNNLYGSALYALAGGLRPTQTSVFGGR